ncbi:glycosyltransferase family 4 protein [Salinicoccus albus]|uniref:glycosyltransferase family 4 protein n=1 Tax=Salinicoccus albus TaxID=418756 RepID=UPI00037907CB|nr:glycosyltransferase family 4 protein [Salinicoccus albus]
MKILLISQNFYPEIGSGANRFKDLYQQLSRVYDVDMLTTDPSYPNMKMYNDEKYWDDEGLNASDNIIRIPMKNNKQSKNLYIRSLYYLELAYKVRYFIKRYQKEYDVIYVTSPNIFVPWATFFGHKQNDSVLKVLDVRDLWPDSVKEIDKIKIDRIYPLLKYLERLMYKKADKIVINNEGFRAHISEQQPEKPILYLPNSFNADEIAFCEAGNDFQVIYTGNIGLAQSYDQLLEVANRLEDEKVDFNIIGYGAHAHSFKEYIQENNFKYVRVFDEKTREECLELIRQHNVQLSLLKQSEVFMNVLPGKVIDGIGSGIPVVTNLGGYTNTLINNNAVGIAIEKASTEEIVDAIIKIRDDHAIEARYRENSRDLLKKEFIWENNIRKLSRFIEMGNEHSSV